jgi:2-oxoisovalerate dehydrogenase E1 component alpha subunit
VLVDAGRKKLDVSNEEILTWYKNMLTGGLRLLLQFAVHQANQGLSIVSIMDVIMFEAQRQGRLSFYMVCHVFHIQISQEICTDMLRTGISR